MLDVFDSVKNLIRFKSVCIDNAIFRLYSRATVLLFIVCAIIISAREFVGDPITCMGDDSTIKQIDPLNAYCWIFGTFTIERHLKGQAGRDNALEGVGPGLESDEILYHRYYQWVYFVLLFQAASFYIPRAMWGVWERGKIGFLSKDLETPFLQDVWTPERKTKLLQYFAQNFRGHNFYAFKFFFCELLNFANAVSQIYFLDWFLEHQFSKYGLAVTMFQTEKEPFVRDDPMARLFPKMTKCTFRNFGAGGSVQTRDLLCILPLNAVNEKMFVFLWFWLVFVAAAGILAILYRVCIFWQPWLRVLLLRASIQGIPNEVAEVVVRKIGFGDWFLLQQLSKNANPLIMRDLVLELAEKSSKLYV